MTFASANCVLWHPSRVAILRACAKGCKANCDSTILFHSVEFPLQQMQIKNCWVGKLYSLPHRVGCNLANVLDNPVLFTLKKTEILTCCQHREDIRTISYYSSSRRRVGRPVPHLQAIVAVLPAQFSYLSVRNLRTLDAMESEPLKYFWPVFVHSAYEPLCSPVSMWKHINKVGVIWFEFAIQERPGPSYKSVEFYCRTKMKVLNPPVVK